MKPNDETKTYDERLREIIYKYLGSDDPGINNSIDCVCDEIKKLNSEETEKNIDKKRRAGISLKKYQAAMKAVIENNSMCLHYSRYGNVYIISTKKFDEEYITIKEAARINEEQSTVRSSGSDKEKNSQ
jgi:hypothetical protein